MHEAKTESVKKEEIQIRKDVIETVAPFSELLIIEDASKIAKASVKKKVKPR